MIRAGEKMGIVFRVHQHADVARTLGLPDPRRDRHISKRALEQERFRPSPRKHSIQKAGTLQQTTHVDLDRLSWHDCHVWGFEFCSGDPDEQDWTSDLLLDIDYIVEWICDTDGSCEFRVAPAELVFHGVTDLAISIRWSDSNLQAALFPVSIHAIERERIADQKVYLNQPYYRWHIGLNSPPAGEITFGAVGFTQTLVANPQVTNRQHLTRAERSRLRPLAP